MNAYNWCQVLIKTPVTHIETSGTELFFDYLRVNKHLDKFQDTRVFNNIIKFVDIVRDYDTWRWEEQRLAANLGLEMYRMGIMKGTKTTCIVMLTGVAILVVQDKISSVFKNKIHKK